MRELPGEVIDQQSYFRYRLDRSPVLEEEDGPVLEYDQEIAPEFNPGDRVVHPYFGRGQVLKVQGSGVSARLRVRFADLGEKLLLVKYAKLKKVL